MNTVLGFILYSHASFAASGITYQGRLLKPDGTPVLSTSVQFLLEIRTPGAEDCLMFSETQTHDLSTTSGAFAISLNDGTGTRQDTHHTWGLFDALSNRKAFSFVGGDCTGVANYTPGATDNRKFRVYFNDGTFAPGTWEPLPLQTINYIPMAIETYAVGGFNARSLVRVEDSGTLGNISALTTTQYGEILALLGGTSTQYSRTTHLNGSALPTIGTGQSVRWTGSAWEAYTPPSNASLPTCTSGQVLTSDGTTLSCVAGGGAIDGDDITSGTIGGTTAWNTSGNITTTGNISGTNVSSTTTSMRNLRIYETTNTNYVQIQAPAGLTPNYSLTLPVDDGTSGQVLSTNGSGVLSWWTPASSNVNLSQIRSTVNSMNPVFPSVACTTSQTLRYDSLTDTYQCSEVTAGASSGALLNGGNTGAITAGTNDGTALTLETNNAARLTIDSTGRVGIGTSTPSSPLHLYTTDLTNSGVVIENSATGNVSRSALTFKTTSAQVAQISLGAPSAVSTGADMANALNIRSPHTPGITLAAADALGKIRFYTGDDTAANERMRIESTGNVGIGTTNPGRLLHVNGPMRLQPATLPTGAAGDLAVDSGDGNKLKWYDGSSWQTVGTGTSTGDILNGGNTGAVVVGTNNATSTTLETNNVARLTILSDGKVGVGTTTPAYALDVSGEINVAASVAGTASGRILQGGSPLIHNYSATGTTGQNMFVGLNSGNSTMAYNSNVDDASRNTALGANTLSQVTHGRNNTAVGAGTLNSSTTGGWNTAVGALSLATSTTASYNVGLGFQSLNALTAGGSNTGLGAYSLHKSQTGVDNVAVGASAMLDSTTARFSVGVGAYSLGASGVGDSNTALGHAAMQNKSGAQNVVVGKSAAMNTGALNDAVVIGYRSGLAQAGSTGNILLGYQAGDAITSGSYNILLGYDIDTPTATTSNFLNIGNLIYATGLATGSTASTGSVGIGTASPGRLLHVNGPMRLTASALPTGATGDIAIDSGDGNKLKWYNGSGWQTVGTGSGTGDLLNGGNTGAVTVGTNNGTNLTLETDNTPRMTVLSDGKVGIGASDPATLLDVRGTATVGDLTTSYTYAVQAGADVYPGHVIAAYTTTGQPQLVFNRARGTTVAGQLPVNDLDMNGAITASAYNGTQYELSSGISMLVDGTNVSGSGNHPGGRIEFKTRSTQTGQYSLVTAMTIRNSGNVGIGTINPGEKLEVNGSVKATSFITTSDRRLKTDITPAPGWDAIRQLEGVRYKLIGTGTEELGLIAQDVERVFPEAVSTNAETGYKGVKYQSLISPIIEALKETHEMCEMSTEESQREIASLKANQKKMENEIEELKKLVLQMQYEIKNRAGAR